MKEVYRRKDELWVNDQKINEETCKVYVENPKKEIKEFNTYQEMLAELTNFNFLGVYLDYVPITHKPVIVVRSWWALHTYTFTKRNFEIAKVITTFEPIRLSVKELLDFLTVEQFAEYCRDRNIENIQIGG